MKNVYRRFRWNKQSNQEPFYVTDDDGTPISAKEVESNPDKYHIVESALAESIVRESEARSDYTLGKGWVKVAPKKSRLSRITEDDSQSLLATQHSLTTRGFTQDGNNWTRGALTVLVATDGSWKCGKDVGKDKTTLESTLDSKYPHESFRHRLTEAFQSLGHTPREAEIASRANESVLLDAWTVIMGGNRDAARHARGEREIDPRQVAFLQDVRSR